FVDRSDAGVLYDTDDLDRHVIAQPEGSAQSLIQAIAIDNVSARQSLVDDGNLRPFRVVMSSKFAAAHQRDLHGGKVLWTDLVGIGVYELFPTRGRVPINRQIPGSSRKKRNVARQRRRANSWKC